MDTDESSSSEIETILPMSEVIPEWNEQEIKHFSEVTGVNDNNMTDIRQQLPKLQNGKEISLTWYKNWVVGWNQATDEAISTLNNIEAVNTSKSFVNKAYEKFGDVVQLVQTYCQDWEDSPMDILCFFFCIAAFSNPQYNKTKTPIYDDKFLLNGYHVSLYAFAAYGGSKSCGKLNFLHKISY